VSLDLEREGVRLPEPAADPATGPVATVDRREAAARWAALVGQLPPAYRAPIVLRHVDGLSYPDLAAVLGRPEGTVKAQVHRGLALLRTAWEAAEQRDREEMTA
jgi:RNA polymerase sigma-70 factor (ECF subfamily)